MIVWGSFYLWDNSASQYVDHEFAASDIPGAAVTLIGETTDKLYMGLDRRFYAVFFELITAGVYGSLLDWEYWDGSAWKNLPIARNFVLDAISGVLQFRAPNDWSATTKLLIMKLLIELEMKLGTYVNFPWGIRCVLKCRK